MQDYEEKNKLINKEVESMDIKSNKGLSMIAVIIVLAIIIFTVFQTVIIVKKWIQKEELEDVTTTMLLIQARCKTYKDKETMEEVEDEDEKVKLKGTLIKKVEDNEYVNNLIEKEIIKKDSKYYLLSQKDLEDLRVYETDETQVFLVNYSNTEVIYANGVVKDGETVYKLSDIKGEE